MTPLAVSVWNAVWAGIIAAVVIGMLGAAYGWWDRHRDG